MGFPPFQGFWLAWKQTQLGELTGAMHAVQSIGVPRPIRREADRVSWAIFGVMPCDLKLAPHLEGEAKAPALRSKDRLHKHMRRCDSIKASAFRVQVAAAHFQGLTDLFG